MYHAQLEKQMAPTSRFSPVVFFLWHYIGKVRVLKCTWRTRHAIRQGRGQGFKFSLCWHAGTGSFLLLISCSFMFLVNGSRCPLISPSLKVNCASSVPDAGVEPAAVNPLSRRQSCCRTSIPKSADEDAKTASTLDVPPPIQNAPPLGPLHFSSGPGTHR